MLLAEAEAIASLAKKYNLDPAVLMAVVAVESNGKVFGETGKPIIRWEGHYFDRLVKPELQATVRKAGLAHPSAGRIKNPRSQARRYDILEDAASYDVNAALMSISIGVGQVMGSHYSKLGFASPKEMFDYACKGFEQQVDLMLRYIVAFGLLDELQRLDWAGFARGYNGPAYKKYKYDTKMAAAYEQASGRTTPALSNMVRMGQTGKRVREVQQLLVRAGYAIKVDGDFGPSTRDAVKHFQTQMGVTVDGVVGPQTMEQLNAYRVEPDEALGVQPALEVQSVKAGLTAAIGGGAGLTAAQAQLDAAAEKLGTIPGLELISNGLTVAAVVISLAGLAYAARGWIKNVSA